MDNDGWIPVDYGQEAYVSKGNLNHIEGIGGILDSEKPITVARRIGWNNPVYDFEGHDVFCRHLASRLLDEYFVKTGRYSRNHIPIPFGSFNGANAGYYYEFIEGSEGFPLVIPDEDYHQIEVRIDDWNSFIGSFNSFGFDAGRDIADPIDGRTGKNVIFCGWDMNKVYETGRLHSNWRRIDFGTASYSLDFERFAKGLERDRSDLTKVLGDYYKLVFLTGKYSQFNQNLTEDENHVLEMLVLRFRREKIEFLNQ